VSIQRLQAYYGFTSALPFGRGLAPSMLYRHSGHAEAVARLSWCIEQRAVAVLTGEVGAGKTVAVRAATAALDPSRHVVIYLPNPSVGVRGMMHHLVCALGNVPAFHTATLIPQAADALAAEYAEKGRAPVVAIDEAHLLDNQQMEAVRMLTNHDMDSGTPFSVLLIGQPTLRQRLRLGVLAALDQRISVRYHLAGMTQAETGDYISHHLKIAGRTDTLFSADAVSLIHNASRGYPRAVNNLATGALIAAFIHDNPIVDEKAARGAISENNTD
jgi:type II secretory pathway predicted ATPase ExeA